jgi:hypothetical protein
MFLFVSTTGRRERATWVSFAAGERKEEDLAAKSMLKISHISPSCPLMTFTKAGVCAFFSPYPLHACNSKSPETADSSYNIRKLSESRYILSSQL